MTADILGGLIVLATMPISFGIIIYQTILLQRIAKNTKK